MNEYREEIESIEPHVTIFIGDGPTPYNQWQGNTVFTYGDSGLTSDIHHRFGDNQSSFDLTDFGSAKVFTEVLNNLNLHPVEEYFRICHKHTEETEKFVYIWANKNGMIITANNPITGDYSKPGGRHNEEGYGSYIGIEGKPVFVEKATELIKKNGNWKGHDPNGRGFI